MARAHTVGVRLTPAERYRVTAKLDEMKNKGQLPMKQSAAQAAKTIGRLLNLSLTKWHLQASAEALGLKLSEIVHVDGYNGAALPMAHVWGRLKSLEERVTELENAFTGGKGDQQ